jgi:hypothetical protein
VRIYSASSEEALRARKLLKEWAGEGLLTKAQCQVLEEETVCDLRTTNIFLRLVFFFFTVVIVVAAAGLFYVVFLSRPGEQTTGVFCMLFAAACYAAAEACAFQGKCYRYGIEEALAVCSVGFLCAGIELAFLSGRSYSPTPEPIQALVPAAGAVSSLWIWCHFGRSYAFLAAMIFAIFLPGYWTHSAWAQHLIIALVYAAGLAVIATVRSPHRFDYLDEIYSLVEAFLWLGIYLAINLKLSSLNMFPLWLGGTQAALEFPRPFYWATWVLTLCLPPIVLARGIRQKDRFVIAVGAIITLLTFVTNKPYLGWPRHTWDPMLLGILLTVVALVIRRWLASGPGGIRHGFTAARLSGVDKQWMNAGSTVAGLLSPQAPVPQRRGPEFRFGGGRSGGGGASGEF